MHVLAPAGSNKHRVGGGRVGSTDGAGDGINSMEVQSCCPMGRPPMQVIQSPQSRGKRIAGARRAAVEEAIGLGKTKGKAVYAHSSGKSLAQFGVTIARIA